MASEKKTRSVPKSTPKKELSSTVYLMIAVSVIALIVIFLLLQKQTNSSDIYFGNKKLNLEVASTKDSKERGLGGRQRITDDQGMLFVFEGEPTVHCFWMKDMNFPIDILWLSKDQKVIHIEKNVSPKTYPKSFCPELPASQVLEVQAGLSNKYGIDVGSQL